MTVDKLKTIYASLIVYSEIGDQDYFLYNWFMTEEQEVIGILKAETTEEELVLLTAFLTPYEIQFPLLTVREKQWEEAIKGNCTNALEIAGDYRFVAFSFNPNQMNPAQFKASIFELFNREVPILWESECTGILIEEKNKVDEGISYELMIDVLMSDLYVKIKFLVGIFYDQLVAVQERYEFVQRAAHLLFKDSEHNVFTFIDAVPDLLIDQKNSNDPYILRTLLLQEYASDQETIKMIDLFIACNLNISETAKALHLHRNSLQYRLDRLYERIGLDIRKFHHAMALYLVVLATK